MSPLFGKFGGRDFHAWSGTFAQSTSIYSQVTRDPIFISHFWKELLDCRVWPWRGALHIIQKLMVKWKFLTGVWRPTYVILHQNSLKHGHDGYLGLSISIIQVFTQKPNLKLCTSAFPQPWWDLFLVNHYRGYDAWVVELGRDLETAKIQLD